MWRISRAVPNYAVKKTFKQLKDITVNYNGILKFVFLMAPHKKVPQGISSRGSVVVVVLLFYVHGKHLRSCRDGPSVNLTTLFLGRLRPPKRLTSTSCTYYRQ